MEINKNIPLPLRHCTNPRHNGEFAASRLLGTITALSFFIVVLINGTGLLWVGMASLFFHIAP